MSEINYSKKQINPLIEKYKINPETNEVFKNIIAMFDGQTNYQIWAIKCVFDNIISIDALSHIKQFADENQTLIAKLAKQNLVAYKTKSDFDQLNKEISGAISISIIKKGISQFNTKQRELLNDYVFKTCGTDVTPFFAATNATFKKHADFFKKFDALNESRKHNLIVTASAINDISFLIKHITDTFNASYTWEKEDLLSFIAINENCKDVKVVFNNGPIVILEIPNFDASKTICGNGRTAWCLTRESSYFSQYAGKAGNRQFFYFDFSKPERNEVAHVGFTVNNKNGFIYAHSTNNNSMIGNGIRVNGKQMNIQTLLSLSNIDTKLFIHLNGIKGFEWNLDGLAKIINKYSNEVAICFTENNRMIVKILTAHAFEVLCSNTLIPVGTFAFNDNTNVYVVFDTNLTANDNNCMVTMMYSKDAYGSLSNNYILDAYNGQIDKNAYFTKIGIKEETFLGKEKIKPSMLLHKYLDNKNDDEAAKLIMENSDELDVNFELNGNIPIFTIVDNHLVKSFAAIINNPKFNINILNGFGEPLLQSLIYEYRQEPNEAIKNMINTVMDCKNYNVNAQNINLDTAINVAVERTNTLWIVDKLAKNPKIDINTPNDINLTPFENALANKNIDAVKILGHHPDLKIRDYETHEVAKNNNIKFEQYIKPISFENTEVYTTTVNSTIPSNTELSTDEYAKLFSACFSKNN